STCANDSEGNNVNAQIIAMPITLAMAILLLCAKMFTKDPMYKGYGC
ncbi:MAG: hypothetical protein SRB2_04222, partial [Desulfobacteraceae bacterium Eth-SRB2]